MHGTMRLCSEVTIYHAYQIVHSLMMPDALYSGSMYNRMSIYTASLRTSSFRFSKACTPKEVKRHNL